MREPIRITHAVHEAVEMELFIPVAAWEHPATKALIDQIHELVGGATLLGARGYWQGEVENVRIVKAVIRRDVADAEATLDAVRRAIEAALKDWSRSDRAAQEELMFTLRPLRVHEARIGRAR